MTEIHAITSLLLVRDIGQPFDLSFSKEKLHINHIVLRELLKKLIFKHVSEIIEWSRIFWQKSFRHIKLYMIQQLYAKRQQVLSIGYQES